MEKVKTVNTSKYSLLAKLLDYPQEGFVEEINEIQLYLNDYSDDLSLVLEPFTGFVTRSSLDEVQELHTRTFEVQAITTLDLGYLLFGDDYKRAELLVNLNREHKLVSNDCRGELADHLPNVLRLTSMLADDLLKDELIRKLIHPGLKKMIREFNPMNLNKKNEVYERHHKTLIDFPEHYGTLYQRPLVVLINLIEQDFAIANAKDDKSSDFLTSLTTEMKIED